MQPGHTSRTRARATWAVSRVGAEYPCRLNTRLREDAKAVIYGRGDMGLQKSSELAMVEFRHADDSSIDSTMAIGQMVVLARRTLVSGSAKGIEQAAVGAALETGGMVRGVPSESLRRL